MTASRLDLTTGRIYDGPGAGRFGVLVDRLWPRGIRREDPRVGVWCRDVAPSTALRRWYGHDPARHEEFQRRYVEELDTTEGKAAVGELLDLVAGRPATLLTATKQVDLSEVPILLDVVRAAAAHRAADG